MKTFISVIFFLLVTCSIHAQKWDNTYGNSNIDEVFQEVIECYDKGYLISGAKDVLPYPNLLIKTDINGAVLWERTIQHDNLSITKGAISQNSTGEIAIARLINFPNGDQWPLVTKLDSCGNKLWCRYYIDDEYSHGWFNDLILFDNGDVLALGYLFTLANYNERIFLYYIDANGNLIWRKNYASKDDHPLVLERTGGGVQKFGDQYIINGWCAYPYPGNPGSGLMRPFFIGIDSAFEEQWILPFGVNDSIIGMANDVIPLNDSVYMGIGYKWENSNPNSILMFFTNEGEELGYNQIYNNGIGSDIEDNIIDDIVRLNDSLFIASIFVAHEDESYENGEFIIDTAASIYDFELRPNTSSSTLIKTFDNKYVIGCTYRHPSNDKDIYLYKINESLQHDTVYTGNYTYDSLCPYQIESGIIDITGCLLITDVGEIPTPKEYFEGLNTIPIKAYPNPVNGGEITFEFLNTECLAPPSVPPVGGKPPHLSIYNIFGEKVYEERVYRYQGKSKLNVSNWNVGMYVAIIYDNNKVVGQSKFVVQ